MVGIRMVVGLGNPGEEYVHTRHNMGFKVIDLLAASLGIEAKRRRFGAHVGEGEFSGQGLILLKPWQFMNFSGRAVARAVGFYRVGLNELLVVTDDMDLEPGRIRLRARGSAGGHNGLADIIEKLGTDEFARLRVGIGRSAQQDPVEYVLDRPTGLEKPLLDMAVERAKEAVLCWVQCGIEVAMNRFNRADLSSRA